MDRRGTRGLAALRQGKADSRADFATTLRSILSTRPLRPAAYCLLVCITLAACRPSPPATGSPEPRPVGSPTVGTTATAGGQPLRVGAIFNLGADGGPQAREQWEGATLAVELANARGGALMRDGTRRTLDLVVYDDDGVPERTALAMRSLATENGALAVVGPAEREAARAAAVVAERDGIPLVTLGERGDEPATPRRWSFGLNLADEEALATLVEHLASTGTRRLGWIAPRTARAATIRTSLGSFATGTDRPILFEETYGLGETDLSDSLGRLAEAAPEQIIGWPRDAGDAANLARAAASRAPRSRLYLGPAAGNDGFIAQAGPSIVEPRAVTVRLLVADDLVDVDPLTPAIRDFRRAYRLRFGTNPTSSAALSWDAVRLVVDAVERSGTDRAAVREALETTRSYAGATGAIAFNARHDGLDRTAFVIAQATSGGWRLPP